MLLHLYRLLWKIARPALRLHRRLGDGFEHRLVPPRWPLPQEGRGDGTGAPRRLWLHSASGGEAYLVYELLHILSAWPGGTCDALLCTSCTRQGLEILQRAQRELQREDWRMDVNYLPLDELDLMRRAVRQAFGPPAVPGGPKVLALLETELWPGLLQACREYGAHVIILNGRLTEGSFRAYRFMRPALRRIAPERILAVSPENLERFRLLFGPKTSCSLMPNIKFDRAANAPDALALNCGDRYNPVIALASIREEEEELILPVLGELLRLEPRCIPVLAPRHLHRLEAWEKRLRNQRLDFIRASSGVDWEQGGRIVLWDSFGQLHRLYALAGTVFVGGSLAPLGGQNFLEPLNYGLIPCVGRFWDNFAWVGEELFELGLARRVQDAGELPPMLLEQLKSPPDKALVRERFTGYVAPRRGGTRQAAEALRVLLQE
ncbi:MAG: 3-deoxy-D-manno-octulosonic acid transferase [Deltaproteobacteria bacterium]|jgi:3-deoxy-D-manno-octulosonic-acid transferase|nr:3-deoxy-D-manno-octulosonic acid transferase [Deltaproteobacteria bacterium]